MGDDNGNVPATIKTVDAAELRPGDRLVTDDIDVIHVELVECDGDDVIVNRTVRLPAASAQVVRRPT